MNIFRNDVPEIYCLIRFDIFISDTIVTDDRIYKELVNQHAWKLDDALHEVREVRADLSSLLAPRATIPKQLMNHQDTWRPRHAVGAKPAASPAKARRSPALLVKTAQSAAAKGASRGAKARTQALLASGCPRFSWRERSTLCMRFQNGTCKDPSTCRFLHRCAVALFPMAQLVVATTRHPSMCQHRTRKPASATRGTSLRRYRQSRFASQLNLQAQLAWANVPVSRHTRRPPQPRTAFRSPTAWRSWRALFQVHLLRPSPVTMPSLQQMHILTLGPSLSMEANAEVFFSAPHSSPKLFSI